MSRRDISGRNGADSLLDGIAARPLVAGLPLWCLLEQKFVYFGFSTMRVSMQISAKVQSISETIKQNQL